MKAWVYVEGPSDVGALKALWQEWCERLREGGHGIEVIPLDGKARFFQRLGALAAEKLAANARDVVVGLPDLYPNEPYQSGPYRHDDLAELQSVQMRLVRKALETWPGVSAESLVPMLSRFCPSGLKHDLEMLLLAAKDELRKVLNTRDKLGDWRLPVEDQDQGRPPKRVVEDLFSSKSAERRHYRDTRDAPHVVRLVKDIRKLLYPDGGQLNCPAFKAVLDWLGERFQVPANE